MKAWLCVLIVMVLSAPQVLASGLGLHGSYWDSKEADDAWGGGALFRLNLHDRLLIDLRGSYFKFDGVSKGIESSKVNIVLAEDSEEFPGVMWLSEYADRLEVDMEVIPVEVALLAHFDVHDRITPYLGGGVGYYFLDAKMRKSAQDTEWLIKTSDEFGFFAVNGLHIRLNEYVQLFGEVRYTWLEFKKVKYRMPAPKDDLLWPAAIRAFEYEADLKMSGFGANVGLLFVF